MEADGHRFSFIGKRGFPLVVDKVEEAHFFLEKMRSSASFSKDFHFYFSAFISAARSITWTLQYVMADYPNFEEWYKKNSEALKNNKLAKFFVTVRNEDQKRGLRPIYESGFYAEGKAHSFLGFVETPLSDVKELPEGDIRILSESYMHSLVSLVATCYRDFDTYVDPRMLFTKKGLSELGWSIDDLEEYIGFPRGYTNIPGSWEDLEKERIKALRYHGFDEEFEKFIEMYNVLIRPPRYLDED